ncbi:MAG TPA: zinc ribbon domain-containing protein [Ruminococcus sp.]|nr:zinc ribbon domain-containing protein [Ruminococcus sp.]
MDNSSKLVPALCPQCGATINVDSDQQLAYCSYCGTQLIVSHAIQNYYYKITNVNNNINIENKYVERKTNLQAILDFADGIGQRSHERYMEAQRKEEEKRKKHEQRVKTIWWIIGFITIPYITIPIYLILKSSNKPSNNNFEGANVEKNNSQTNNKSPLKIALIIIGVFFAWFIIQVGISASNNDHRRTSDISSTNEYRNNKIENSDIMTIEYCGIDLAVPNHWIETDPKERYISESKDAGLFLLSFDWNPDEYPYQTLHDDLAKAYFSGFSELNTRRTEETVVEGQKCMKISCSGKKTSDRIINSNALIIANSSNKKAIFITIEEYDDSEDNYINDIDVIINQSVLSN